MLMLITIMANLLEIPVIEYWNIQSKYSALVVFTWNL